MSAKSQESHRAEAELASTTAGARCTGKHGGPEALIKTAMTPPRRTHVHTLCVSVVHAKSSLGLSTSGSGIHLQALLLASLSLPAGSSQLIGLSMETDM